MVRLLFNELSITPNGPEDARGATR